MRLLEFLAQSVINAFGITQPPPERQRMITLIVGGLLLGIFALVLCMGGFFYLQLHSGRSGVVKRFRPKYI